MCFVTSLACFETGHGSKKGLEAVGLQNKSTDSYTSKKGIFADAHAWGVCSTAADKRPMLELGLAWGAGIRVGALRSFHRDVPKYPILYTYLEYTHAVNIPSHTCS